MHEFGFAAGPVVDQVPTIQPFSMVSPQTFATVSVSNRNEYPLVLTLVPWSDTHFTWATASPVTIPAHSSASLRVNHTGTELSATATVGWAITTGLNGTITASADWDPGT